MTTMYKECKTQLEISRREDVMSRVKTVRGVRTFMASPLSSIFLATVLILCASIVVSFDDVLHNIMVHKEWGGRLSYTYSSLIHSRIVVQVFAFFTTVSLTMVFIRSIRTSLHFVGNLSPLRFFRS